jgi:hypothetical protein
VNFWYDAVTPDEVTFVKTGVPGEPEDLYFFRKAYLPFVFAAKMGRDNFMLHVGR